MKTLLIVNVEQFGYHTDTYFYCRNLQEEYSITYLCWDYGYERIPPGGVRVVYVPRTGGKAHRLGRFLRAAHIEIRTTSFDVVFVVYFRLASLLRVFPRCRTIVLDIRTGYVMKGRIKRLFFNTGIFLESMAFRNVSIISEELRASLRIPRSKSKILPLGAEVRNMPAKKFNAMRLIYVGTFVNREIHTTVEGFDRFACEVRGKMELSYDIIGFGFPDEEDLIIRTVERSAARDLIRIHGRIPHQKLGPNLEHANIGVAFVPIVAAQQPQPYTKVFEYLCSGMPVLATANDSNKQVITPNNGVLVQDTAEGVYEGLRLMSSRLSTYDSDRIKSDSRLHSWSEIVNSNLKPYLDKVLSEA